MNPERSAEGSKYWTLAPYVRREWPTILQALFGTVIFVSFWPILAWLSGNILEQLAAGNVPVVSRFIAITMAGFALQKIGQYIQDSLMAKAALEVAFNLRRDVYTHIHRLSLTYFERSQTGDLSYRLTEDIDRIGEVVQKLFHDFLPSVLQLVVVLGYMVYLNWQLTLTAVVLVPILAVLAGWFGEQMLKFSRRSQNLVSDLSSLVTEVFSGIRLVRAFAAEDYEVERFTHEAEKNRQAKYKAAWLQAVQYPVVGFTYAVVVMLILLVGTWQISQENLTGASFGSYVVAALMLIDPVNHVIINYGEFKQGEASVDRVIELLEIESAVRELPTAAELPKVTGRVEYRNVTFGYETDEPVLRNLDLLALPGEKIALVGSSGAGKSTLVNLLPRFYDPQSGQIFIDDVDVATVTLRSLRRQIGIVPQETTLFSGTIAQNIAFGQKDFDIEAVEAAARIANAHDFISQFSQGYYTWMGERGVNLSGGQRQRVAIARAVLLNPRILILDEATSALDAESEALVQEALERLMSDRTVFIIAHRLATVRDADRILVMEKGQVIEAGTHSELLANQSRYAQFYAQQFAGSSLG
ncbi:MULTISPECIES: ABC transporter ATP-binding protein [Cyanophyceae]|uniref:ABC transporter ATP-binding protein/permease n=1 Tax=Leptolyngbya subtilissima DQ-A4 TaxID=2933933 RepID=A0ABV0K5J5_9CYAN|nr:ABC transporter ATP-binding protein [Nodosilinea sp. FACHB-141]MBD2112913.1 ABC transporter ATP-binding protein [Nodosilinea sp. FACHB-141]